MRAHVTCHGASIPTAAASLPQRADGWANQDSIGGLAGFDGLRVLIVGPVPPPAGGMANQTRQLAELLRREGAVVDVVVVNAPYRPAWAGRIRGLRAVFRLLPYLRQLWSSCSRADLIHVMANSGWSWHLFAAPAVWIAWLRGIPVVINYRGGGAKDFLHRSARWVRPTVRRSSSLVLPSGFLLEIFERHGMAGRIVPNVVDLDCFRPATLVPGPDGGPHLVVTRNLEAIYGNDTALRAFALVLKDFPSARLSIAGSGPEGEMLRDLARRLNVEERVSFTGRLDRDQMAVLYRDAHLMINASRVDNMPNAILEALASGVPVVTTDVGGIPHIVSDRETAMLVRPDNPAAMAEAIKKVLSSGALRERLVSGGLVQVSQYCWQAVRTELAAVYHVARQAKRRPLI